MTFTNGTRLGVQKWSHRAVIALLMVLLAATQSASAMTVKAYLEMRNDKAREIHDWIEVYVNGLGEAYGWSNALLDSKGTSMMFCAPNKLVLTGQNYEDILDARIKFASTKMSASQLSETPVEYLLLNALAETFPCPAASGQAERK